MSHAQTATALDDFLELCCTEIERRAVMSSSDPGVLQSGAAAFRSALSAISARPMREGERSELPVLASVSELASNPLSRAAVAAVHEIPWQPTPRSTDDGTSIALGLVDQARDLGDLVCGLMLVAAGGAYPEHSHSPQEIYLPLAGNGQWRYGGVSSYRSLAADALLYNHPHDVHGMIAGDEPELALYILWP